MIVAKLAIELLYVKDVVLNNTEIVSSDPGETRVRLCVHDMLWALNDRRELLQVCAESASQAPNAFLVSVRGETKRDIHLVEVHWTEKC